MLSLYIIFKNLLFQTIPIYIILKITCIKKKRKDYLYTWRYEAVTPEVFNLQGSAICCLSTLSNCFHRKRKSMTYEVALK